MVPCEGCIRLAICMANITFIPNKKASLGFELYNKMNNCDIFTYYIKSMDSEYLKLYHEVKRFLLAQKGLLKF
jgi:hypothetical protein